MRFSPELDLFFVFLSNRVHPEDPEGALNDRLYLLHQEHPRAGSATIFGYDPVMKVIVMQQSCQILQIIGNPMGLIRKRGLFDDLRILGKGFYHILLFLEIEE